MGAAACASSRPPDLKDVRDEYGKWVLGELSIIENGPPGTVNVHFVGWDAKWYRLAPKFEFELILILMLVLYLFIV